MKQDEVKQINIQLIFSLISIVSIIISMILLQNEKCYLQKKQPIFKPRQALNLSKFNRVLILIIALVFLVVNYRLRSISQKEGEDLESYNLQILSSYLVVISAIITLYVVFNYNEELTTSDVENPII